MDTSDATTAARRAGDSSVLETAARLGYGVNGLVHLLIAWLGLQMAWASYAASADQSGALQTLASTGFGRFLLWVCVAGFLGLGLWQVTEVVVGRGETSDRVKAGAKAAVYLVLGFSCFGYAKGASGSSSSQQSVDLTASLMKQPAGRVLVGAVGLAILGVGVYHVVKGWRRKFLQDLKEHPGEPVMLAGRIGYVAKGLALGLVGVLFGAAGLHGRAGEATGLDGALRSLLGAPFGRIVLSLVALGFAAYGVYSFARARYARV